jgi:acyl carrier protein
MDAVEPRPREQQHSRGLHAIARRSTIREVLPEHTIDRDRALAAVSAAWSGALGVEDFDFDDDFFGLGGHSLLVLEVVDAVEAATGVAIPFPYFFANPNIRALASYVSEHG